MNDRRLNEARRCQRFTSPILPPYMWQLPQVPKVLPLLSPAGLSTRRFSGGAAGVARSNTRPDHPTAAESRRASHDEVLTVLVLNRSETLRQPSTTPNAEE